MITGPQVDDSSDGLFLCVLFNLIYLKNEVLICVITPLNTNDFHIDTQLLRALFLKSGYLII